MRGLATCCIALAMVGCKPAEKPAETAAGDAAAMKAAPAAISLADVAGTWSVRGKLEGSDNTVVTYDMVASPDRSGWSITFPGRKPIPVRVVVVEGDSVVTEAGPFESAIRKGVQVSTRGVARLQGGNLVGTTVARYQVTTPDSVARLRFVGTRAH
jgi:hypothetical protein